MGSNADEYLAQLMEMGYEFEVAAVAISNTQAAGLNEALSWLMDHPTADEQGSSTQPVVAVSPPFQEQTFFSPLAAGANVASIGGGADPARMGYDSGAQPSHREPDWQRGAEPAQQYYPQIHREPSWHQSQQWQGQQQPFHNPHHQHQQPPPGIAWQPQQVPAPGQYPQSAAPKVPRRVAASGVAALLEREQQRVAASDRVMDTALHDLQALMGQAQDMVALAEQFRAALARQPLENADEEVVANGLAEDLVSMGIAAPVTKEAAGRQYHVRLARELAAFLATPMERAGGLLTLPDVYCLFNRARGLELVSPDDLLQAVKQLPAVGAPFELREFSDGVRVLQSLSHSTQQVCARIGKLVGGGGDGPGPAVSAASVAAALQVPVAVAARHLQTAEEAGTLCRDEGGPEGLRFYRNFFAQVQAH
mmetsp:Transcript_15225/g.45951  ORF Transcript_15225/g.45951 Transcript_15225/m.45951 type:complete len:422 (+) Transcript_15225:178-1443(+)